MAKEHVFVVDGDTTQTLYTDAVDLRKLGSLTVTRASNVEFDNGRGGWVVIFSRVGSPILDSGESVDHLRTFENEYLAVKGGLSYRTTSYYGASVWVHREDALAAEVAHLNAEMVREKGEPA